MSPSVILGEHLQGAPYRRVRSGELHFIHKRGQAGVPLITLCSDSGHKGETIFSSGIEVLSLQLSGRSAQYHYRLGAHVPWAAGRQPFRLPCGESEARFLSSFDTPCISSTIIANR